MALIEENLLGLILLLLVAAAVVAWVLLSNRRERVELTRDEEAPRRTLPPLPKAPPPVEPPPVEPVAAMRFPEAIPETAAPADDLTRMKGVGPKVVAALAALGVTRYDQIAAWSDEDAALVDAKLGTFKGRIARDHWVEQARLLAAGDLAGYEAKFGKL